MQRDPYFIEQRLGFLFERKGVGDVDDLDIFETRVFERHVGCVFVECVCECVLGERDIQISEKLKFATTVARK